MDWIPVMLQEQVKISYSLGSQSGKKLPKCSKKKKMFNKISKTELKIQITK